MKNQQAFFEWFQGLSQKEQEEVVERVLEWISGGERIREVEKGEGKKRKGYKCPYCGGLRINAAGNVEANRCICVGHASANS